MCFNFHFKGLKFSPLLLLSDEMPTFLNFESTNELRNSVCNLCSVWCLLPSYMSLRFPLLLELFLVAESDDLPLLGLVPDSAV